MTWTPLLGLLLVALVSAHLPVEPSTPPTTTDDVDYIYDDYSVREILKQFVDPVLDQLREEREERVQSESELTGKIHQLNRTIKHDKDELTQEREERVKSESELTGKIHQLQTKNQQMETRVRKLSMRVAFAATLGSTVNYRGGALVYDTVIANIGGAYNASNGVFTAPLAGVYFFTVTVFSGEARQASGVIVLNDARKCKAYARPRTHQTGTCDVVLTLRQGDKVKVRAAPAQHHTVHNFFSGFLLYAD